MAFYLLKKVLQHAIRFNKYFCKVKKTQKTTTKKKQQQKKLTKTETTIK
jgi:hypothetical protein